MDGDRAELEAARVRAREASARRVQLPDPRELPNLPPGPFADGGPIFDVDSIPEVAGLGPTIPESFARSPSLSLAVWKDIWKRDLRFRVQSHRGLVGRLIVGLKKLLAPIVRAALADHLDRQRYFNLVMLRHLEEVDRYVLKVAEPYAFMRDLAVPDLISRADSLFGILDRRLDVLEAELRRLRDLESDRLSPVASAPPTAGRPVTASPTPGASLFVDHAYYLFESLHRGTEEEIRQRQSAYLPTFRLASPVVDLGSGRGEMLALLKEQGIQAYGVDANAAMVAVARKQGLEVVEGDAIEHLRGLEDDSLGGAFSAQTFEHWEREQVVDAVKLIYRKLRDGAPFVMETQNPLSLVVGASSFWRDPTHVRPVHPEAFEFLVHAVGFRSVERLMLSPFPAEHRLPRVRALKDFPEAARTVVEDVNRAIDAVDELLHGHRDYAIVSRK